MAEQMNLKVIDIEFSVCKFNDCFRCCNRAQPGENGCCEDNLDRTAYR